MLQTITCPNTKKNHSLRKISSLAFAGRGLKALQRGFTLVEIALVLLITGLALGAGVSILRVKLAQAKIDTTKVKTEAVRVALINYVAQNYRLPCPAAPGLKRGDTGYNLEQRNIATAGSEFCILANGLINSINGTALTGVSRGTVPCTTLGLPEDTCIDGWGVRLSYFVQNKAVRLTQSNVNTMEGTMSIHKIPPPGAATPLPLNQINACSVIVGDNSCNGLAVAMIISHGANRGGGFPPTSATSLPAVVGTDISAYEAENVNNNIQFIQNDFVESLPNSFDDIIVPLVPRDSIVTLSQNNALKDPKVQMNERFETVTLALLQRSYNYINGTSPNKTITLVMESGSASNYTLPSTPVIDFTGCPAPFAPPITLPVTTQLLPNTTASPPDDVPALTGLTNDIWGTPIRYRRVNTNSFGAVGSCRTPFFLISYGPDGQTGGASFGLDDIVYPVTRTAINAAIIKLGGW